jgi:S-adenosyl-L-methionine hydrolase (adenosine-forming)
MDAVISFLSDFGTSDTSVGQCKGVIAGISPRAVVVDISHHVPHFDIMTGSWMLRSAVRHFPQCVHLAVVDPGVGTTRRPIAIEATRGDVLIGPDNGLLIAAAEALGGISCVVELVEPAFRRQPVSNTFHARDIFCPAAAHVSHGVGMHLLGPNLDGDSLVRLPEPETRVADGVLTTPVMAVNEFGSLALAASGDMLIELHDAPHVRVTIAGATLDYRVVRTFGEAEPGETVVFVDSYGRLCLAINQGDLAARLGIARHDRPAVSITPAEPEHRP